jgi:Xaa-Pro aminopeptidase
MRGFPEAEYASRLGRVQSLMAASGLDALFLTTEAEVRYFTGFLTRFWESPTRPWYLLVPQSGKPVAVIPSIGASLMAKTWIDDIRTWCSPDPGDDGVSLLADTMAECLGKNGAVGVPSGPESHIRMPRDDFMRLQKLCPGFSFSGDDGIIRTLRLVKSDAEIGKIQTACEIAGRAFGRVHEIAGQGAKMSDVFRNFQLLCLEEGADWVPYLAGGKGAMGYDDIIAPATEEALAPGDVMMLDTGLVHDGYFCDYDRNYAIGGVKPEVAAAWQRLLEAAEAGMAAARPGAAACDIYHAMDKVLARGDDDERAGKKGSKRSGGVAGRLGHGLGMQLTEWPSFIPGDKTEIREGMVITLEPGITMLDGTVLVHEDNFAITATGARQLSAPAPKEMWIL